MTMNTPAISQHNGITTAQSTATQTSDPVSQAVDSIQDRLSTSFTDWAVTHGDVQAMADSSTDRPDHSSSGIGGSSRSQCAPCSMRRLRIYL